MTRVGSQRHSKKKKKKKKTRIYLKFKVQLTFINKNYRNGFLSRATKILLYQTLIRPIVANGAETWRMMKKEEQAPLIFERKILRRIYSPK